MEKQNLELKTYTGTKTIKAAPMTANQAKRVGATVPDKYFEVGNASYNPGADGYLVVYPDGYRSWSPKSVFEDAYKISETHVDRMKIELADLNERICKATKALYNYNLIPLPDHQLLSQQIEAMHKYASILYSRIVNAESLGGIKVTD